MTKNNYLSVNQGSSGKLYPSSRFRKNLEKINQYRFE